MKNINLNEWKDEISKKQKDLDREVLFYNMSNILEFIRNTFDVNSSLLVDIDYDYEKQLLIFKGMRGTKNNIYKTLDIIDLKKANLETEIPILVKMTDTKTNILIRLKKEEWSQEIDNFLLKVVRNDDFIKLFHVFILDRKLEEKEDNKSKKMKI